MPNLGSLPPLNSSRLEHSAEQDSCRRLTNVMLPPGRSSWQAPVHNKFEGFSHGLRSSFGVKLRRAGIQLPTGSGFASHPLMDDGDDQHGAKVSSINVAQFCAGPFISPCSDALPDDEFGPAAQCSQDSDHGAAHRSCTTRSLSSKQLIYKQKFSSMESNLQARSIACRKTGILPDAFGPRRRA